MAAMTRRRGSMLEAFRSATGPTGPNGPSPQMGPGSAPVSSPAGGPLASAPTPGGAGSGRALPDPGALESEAPFSGRPLPDGHAPGASNLPPEFAELLDEVEEPTERRLPAPERFLPVLIALFLGFGLGRWSAPGDVQASTEGTPGASEDSGSTRAGAPGSWIPAEVVDAAPAADRAARSEELATDVPAVSTATEAGRSAADRAFLDPENRFSILAITYDDAGDLELAWKTYDYLAERHLPVVSPLESNGKLLLHIGAAAELDELAPLLSLVKSTPSPSGRSEFSTAYFVNLEDYR